MLARFVIVRCVMHDRSFNACFASTEYRDTFTRVGPTLKEGREVPGETPLFVLSNTGQRIDYQQFALREVDYMPLAGVEVGGKSSHVLFSERLRELTRILFDRDPRETDVAFVLESSWLPRVGYHAFYTPTAAYQLHLRLVAEDMMNGAEVVSESARRSLARLLKHNAKRIKQS